MNLEEVRGKWEKGLDLVKSVENNDEVYVILKDRNYFQVNRYFSIGANWHVSVDAQRIDKSQLMDWISSEGISLDFPLDL